MVGTWARGGLWQIGREGGCSHFQAGSKSIEPLSCWAPPWLMPGPSSHGQTWGFGRSLHDPRHWEWCGNVEMSITRQSQIVSSLTYLCVLSGDRQRLDLQQTEPGAAVRAPTPAPCLFPLGVCHTLGCAGCDPAAFTPFCHPYFPLVCSVRQ